MAFATPSSTESDMMNMVNDEKFAQIYTPDENTVQLLDNERTIMNIKPGICVCALGNHSYSCGIHCIRIRIDKGNPFLGLRSRNIPPTPSWSAAGRYDTSPSTYGWQSNYARTLDGQFYESRLQRKQEVGDVYIITLNCDARRLSITNENTKEQDEVDVDVHQAPFPWCLFIHLPRTTARVSLM